MTRETKIGLLVGLAFIIVIGILLSDHLTSATEPPQAQLAQVGNNVRSTTASPTRATQAIFNTPQPQQTAPQNVVPTQQELTQRPAPVQIIDVSGPSRNPVVSTENPPVTFAPPTQTETAQPPVTMAQAPQQQPAVPSTVNTPPTPLQQLAEQHGEPLVGTFQEQNPIRTVTPPVDGIVTNATGTTHIAQTGDSVSKLATKYFGANTRANREAIINANPSLKQDPNKIILGKTYVIPVATARPQQPAAKPVAPASQNANENWYTVQPGDSLSKIAVTQCGTATAVAAIKELNKDTIKNDIIMAGQKLRLPNKAVQ